MDAPALVADAPTGVFRCAGEDEWCVVPVRGATEWKNFCRVIGRDDLEQDPTLATPVRRAASRERIDDALKTWLA